MAGRAKRRELIAAIEETRRSRVISYITSDRSEASGQLAQDALWFIRDQLLRLRLRQEKIPRLDLFLYSRGGDASVPWPLVSMVRDFADEFNVLVPFRAHSAATSICLGADAIVMAPEGQLGPVDVTYDVRAGEGKAFRLSVEDVMGYIRLLKETVGLTDQDQVASVFARLVDKLPDPVILGRVARELNQTRYVATGLLGQRRRKKRQAEIERIVERIAGSDIKHEHCISRKEARQMGLHVQDASPKIEGDMRNLLAEYETLMQLRQPLTPPRELYARQADEVHMELTLASVETTEAAWEFRQTCRCWRSAALPQVPSFQIHVGVPALPPDLAPQDMQVMLKGMADQIAQQLKDQICRTLAVGVPTQIGREIVQMGWVETS